MKFDTTIKQLDATMSGEIANREWEALRLSFDNMADITAQGLLHMANDDVAGMQSLVSKLYTLIIHDENVTGAFGPEQAAAALTAIGSVIDAAAERMRQPIALSKTEAKILRVLAEADCPCSGQDIAAQARCDETVISRHLPGLEEAGLIHRTRNGKRRDSQITVFGRQALQENDQQYQRGVASGAAGRAPSSAEDYAFNEPDNDTRSSAVIAEFLRDSVIPMINKIPHNVTLGGAAFSSEIVNGTKLILKLHNQHARQPV